MTGCWPINPGEQLMVVGAILMAAPPLLTLAAIGIAAWCRDV